MRRNKTRNLDKTGHDGIFTIKTHQVHKNVSTHKTQILRWNIRENTFGLPAMNIGKSKGRTFDRVVIFPTNPMKRYLLTRDLKIVGDSAKLYVAVTRARYSVAFVVDE